MLVRVSDKGFGAVKEAAESLFFLREGDTLWPFRHSLCKKVGSILFPPAKVRVKRYGPSSRKKMNSDSWRRMFSERVHKQQMTATVSKILGLRHRLKQALSDASSNKKERLETLYFSPMDTAYCLAEVLRLLRIRQVALNERLKSLIKSCREMCVVVVI